MMFVLVRMISEFVCTAPLNYLRCHLHISMCVYINWNPGLMGVDPFSAVKRRQFHADRILVKQTGKWSQIH